MYPQFLICPGEAGLEFWRGGVPGFMGRSGLENWRLRSLGMLLGARKCGLGSLRLSESRTRHRPAQSAGIGNWRGLWLGTLRRRGKSWARFSPRVVQVVARVGSGLLYLRTVVAISIRIRTGRLGHAQIEFLEWTEADRLRHSKFVGLRDDKDARSVVKQQP